MERGFFKLKLRVFIGYLVLFVVWYVFVVVMLFILVFRYSFYDWFGGLRMRFVGFLNYVEFIKDIDFWLLFKNNVIIILFCIVGQIGIVFVLVVFMIIRVLKFKEFYCIVIFLFVVLFVVVIGFIWMFMYNQQIGILNWVLRVIGFESLIKLWFDDLKIVIYFVFVLFIWQYIGFYFVILMVLFQFILKEIFEVVEIDGVDGFKRIIYIILFFLVDILKVFVMFCIVGNMKVFDYIYVMIGGGFGKSLMVMVQYVYNNLFIMFKFGYGFIIFVGILIFSFVIILFL